MQRHRVLLVFGIAWLSALILSWWVYKTTTAPQKRQVIQAVAAAQDLPVGKLITAADVKLVTVDRKDIPKGVFLKVTDVMDRSVTIPVSANELLLDRKVAAKGSGESMTALIEPGMRAVSVQVNEMSGVSGFILPGTRVDVLFTRIFTNGDAATTTVIQNAKVIAYGKQLDPQAKVDPREAAKVTVATLLVTQEQAERLALALQRGKIQLVLRNPLDNQVTEETDLITSGDLGIEEPKKEVAREPVRIIAPPPAPPRTPAPSGSTGNHIRGDQDGHVVHVFRGSKLSEDVFE